MNCRLNIASRGHAARSPHGDRRSGLTLVELLVAMTVTLIMAFALIQMFQSIGRGVAAGRANLELAGDLRSVSNMLRSETDNVTVDVRPWTQPGANAGHVEIVDGPTRDYSWVTTSEATMVGDIDDVFSCTVRSTGDPFVGKFVDYARVISGAGTTPDTRVITSQYAEVVWWTRWEDNDVNGTPGPGEVTLYHRVFLIVPELNTELRVFPSGSGTVSHTNPGYLRSAKQTSTTTVPATQSPTNLFNFHQVSDISVKLHRDASGNVLGFAANTLADLTRRENRYGHYPVIFDPTFSSAPVFKAAGVGFPFALSRAQLIPRHDTSAVSMNGGFFLGVDGQPGIATVDDDGNGTVDDANEIGWFGTDDLGVGVPSVTLARIGDDIALTSVLAFDIRVWDPTAQLRYNPGTTAGAVIEMLEPSDRGFTAATSVGTSASPPAAQTLPSASGAFVDLFYGWNRTGIVTSRFSSVPATRSQLALNIGPTYCTWAYDYEHDGIDQDGDGTADEGTDGFDTDNANGVDDVAERETSPPYAVPLRGIEFRIRNYDSDTRQVRQTRVVSNFIPE
ncbi:MAG: prepilin-type N-terminal cleavage/methylation domain-containing protein [Planctomycetales bacterium]|nr:prepilin-type N-terminal cleavage/methylation domain-containing protein [Planctomycetales bacterium]